MLGGRAPRLPASARFQFLRMVRRAAFQKRAMQECPPSQTNGRKPYKADLSDFRRPGIRTCEFFSSPSMAGTPRLTGAPAPSSPIPEPPLPLTSRDYSRFRQGLPNQGPDVETRQGRLKEIFSVNRATFEVRPQRCPVSRQTSLRRVCAGDRLRLKRNHWLRLHSCTLLGASGSGRSARPRLLERAIPAPCRKRPSPPAHRTLTVYVHFRNDADRAFHVEGPTRADPVSDAAFRHTATRASGRGHDLTRPGSSHLLRGPSGASGSVFRRVTRCCESAQTQDTQSSK